MKPIFGLEADGHVGSPSQPDGLFSGLGATGSFTSRDRGVQGTLNSGGVHPFLLFFFCRELSIRAAAPVGERLLQQRRCTLVIDPRGEARNCGSGRQFRERLLGTVEEKAAHGGGARLMQPLVALGDLRRFGVLPKGALGIYGL